MSELHENAHAVAIINLDNSRRVGWAKHFDTKARLDESLRDFNLAAGDRDAYRKGLSFLYGLFMEWTKDERSELFGKVLAEVAGYDAVLDAKLVRAGRRKAQSIRGFDELAAEEAELARAAKNAAKAARAANYDKQWKRAKQHGVENLAAKFGFQSVTEMQEVLARWQEINQREATEARELRRVRKANRPPANPPAEWEASA